MYRIIDLFIMKTVYLFPYPHSYWYTCACNCISKYSLHHETCRYSVIEKHTWWEYSQVIKYLKIFALSNSLETVVLNVQSRYLESVVVAHLNPLPFELTTEAHNWITNLMFIQNNKKILQIFYKLIVNLYFSTIHWKIFK